MVLEVGLQVGQCMHVFIMEKLSIVRPRLIFNRGIDCEEIDEPGAHDLLYFGYKAGEFFPQFSVLRDEHN